MSSLTTLNFLPPPPSRNDSPADFTQKANDFLASLNSFNSELNTLVNAWNVAISDFNDDYKTTAGRLTANEQSQGSVTNRLLAMESVFAQQLPAVDLVAADQLIVELVQTQLETMNRYIALKATTETQAEQIRILTNAINVLSNQLNNKDII